MWGRKEDQGMGTGLAVAPDQLAAAVPEPALAQRTATAPQIAPARRRDSAVSRIGESIKFKGEIQSDEDLFVDGTVEGSITVTKSMLVIGKTSRVNADIRANTLVIHGNVKGTVNAVKRVVIKETGRLEGDLVTDCLQIEDGAVFIGKSAVHIPKVPAGAPPKQPAPAASPSVSARTPYAPPVLARNPGASMTDSPSPKLAGGPSPVKP